MTRTYFKTVATVKHFAVHSGPEPERHEFDAVVSQRDLRESYLPHFEVGIRQDSAYSLMCAYNRVFGKAACGSDLLSRTSFAVNGSSRDTSSPTVVPIDDMYRTTRSSRLRPKRRHSP